jgi:hypothetical protein
MLDRLKKYQLTRFNGEVADMRDVEANMEHKLGEFVLLMKQILPQNILAIKTLKEFDTYVKVAKGAGVKYTEPIDIYQQTIDRWRRLFHELELSVCIPLFQIHTVCESAKQTELKKKIRNTCQEMETKLRLDSDLQKVCHPEWKIKILHREQKLFQGLLSLVPIGLEKAVDISYMLDEYMADFPVLSK